VQLDSRTVGTTEVAINNLAPTGTLAEYVSGSGEMRVKIQCQTTANLINRGDLMSIAYNAPVAPPPTTGLVAAYSLDEGSGTTAADASGNGKTAALFSAGWTTQGRFGAALALNGTSGYARVDAPAWPTGNFSWLVWVYPTNLSGWRGLMEIQTAESQGVEFALSGGAPELWTNGVQRYTAAIALPVNAWTHLALTRAGNVWTLYRNGSMETSWTESTGYNWGTCPALLGVDADSGCTGNLNGYFLGHLDEVKVYDGALTAAEIQAVMNIPIN
jgi:hypothetical protein